MSTKRIISYILCIIIVFTPVIITYAWFTSYLCLTPLTIQTANIASTIKCKKAIDFNFDGTPDLDNLNQFIYESEVTSSGGYPVITLNAQNMFPSQIHSWKITIQNLGDANGYIFLKATNTDDDGNFSNEGNLFKAMSFSIIDDITNEIIGSKYYLANYYTNTVLDCMLINGGSLNMVGYLGGEIDNTKSYRVCLELESYENLPLINVEGSMVKPLTPTEYQALQGSTFNNFFLKLYLTSSNSTDDFT